MLKTAAADSKAPPRKLMLYVRANTSAQQPIYAPTASGLASTGITQPTQTAMYGAAAASADCHPKCTWNCGNADCDEVCDPVCAPPQCETACATINLAACRQRCDPPKCAIVCPTSHCAHGGCPACKTVCSPPKCRTECAEQCESKCSEPQCTWKCNPGQCEKPRCTLQCGGAKTCGLDGNLNARPPPFASGMTVVAKALAATDPKSLSAFAVGGGMPGPAAGGRPSAGPAPAASPIR